MKKSVLIILALVMALTMVLASVSTVGAAKNAAYIRFVGHPVAGDLEFIFGCRGSSSPVGSYGGGIYDVTNSHYEVYTDWYNLPGGTTTFESSVFTYTSITAPGKYKIVLFLKSGIDGGGSTLYVKEKSFAIH